MDTEKLINNIKILEDHGLETVIFTGGEPLLQKNLFQLCEAIKKNFPNLQLRLLTNGLLLKKYVKEVAHFFDVVVVSLDAKDKQTYRKIRGIDGFMIVVKGIRELRSLNKTIEIRIRCMVQKSNYKQIPDIINFVYHLKTDKISFLPVDIFTTDSFGRKEKITNASEMILDQEENIKFGGLIKHILKDKKYTKNDFLVLKGKDLKFINQYYLALNSGQNFPKIQCNTPSFSTILDYEWNVYPCFFMKKIGNINNSTYKKIIKSAKLEKIEKEVLSGKNEFCQKCVFPDYLPLKRGLN